MGHLSAKIAIVVVCLGFLSVAHAGENAVSAGYGFAVLNGGESPGNVQRGRHYDFLQLTYLYERPSTDYHQLALFLEPFAAYVARPHDGADFGFYTGLKWYPMDHANKGLFVTAGTGVAYTTIKFKEQATHFVFTLEAGLGYRFGRFYVEDRLRHYSNGSTARPNRSIHANVVTIGMYF